MIRDRTKLFCLKMNRKTTLKTIGWVLLFPGGIILLQFVLWLFTSRGSIDDFGRFHGVLTASLADKNNCSSLTINGQTLPEWKVERPSNFTYSDLDFEWIEWPSEITHKGTLHLSRMTLVTSSGTVKLDHDWLLQRVEDEYTATAYLDFLMSARDGTLPRPRHHTYYPEGMIEGRLSHFSLGFCLSRKVLWWGVMWVCFSIILLLRQALPRQN